MRSPPRRLSISIINAIDAHAPNFKASIVGRQIKSPLDIERDLRMVGGDIYHSWFPAYDERFAKVSPGLLLLHEIFRAAPDLGITRVDLGKGGAHYKTYYASYEVPLDAGRSIAPSYLALGLRTWDLAEAAAGVLPGKLSQLPVRARRRWSQISAFEPEMGPRLATFARSFRKPPNAA